MRYAVNTGMHQVDVQQYPPDVTQVLGVTPGLEAAALMAKLAADVWNIQPKVVPNPSVAELTAALSGLIELLQPGDEVFLSFAGHGAFVHTPTPRKNTYPSAASGRELAKKNDWETSILLRDRMMLADEYHELLAQIPEGVQLINLIDACSSGTFHVEDLSMRVTLAGESAASQTSGDGIFKALYDFHRDLYDPIVKADASAKPLALSGVHIGASPAYGETQYNETQFLFSTAFDAAMRMQPPLPTYIALGAQVQQWRVDGKMPHHSTVLVPIGSATQAYLWRQPFS